MNKKTLVFRIILIPAAIALFVFLFYLNAGKDWEKTKEFVLCLLCIVLPLIVCCEMMYYRLINKKTNSNGEVIKLRYETIVFYEGIIKKNIIKDFINSYLYITVREAKLDSINCFLYDKYKKIHYINQIPEIIADKEKILNKFKSNKKCYKEAKEELYRLETYDLESKSDWIYDDLTKVKQGQLFVDKSDSLISIIAFIISLISLILTVLFKIGFKFSWWQLSFVAIPLIVEIPSFIFDLSSWVHSEIRVLKHNKKLLDDIYRDYEKGASVLPLIMEEENKVKKEMEDKYVDSSFQAYE